MKTETYDIIVIGSGIAGLSYAIRCAEFADIVVVTKGHIGESNTMYAQGGIAAVFDSEDSIENHINDTLTTGDGLCDRRSVEILAQNAKSAILYLEQQEVNFDKAKDGSLELHLEGGHSRARIVHNADATGKEVENSLVEVVRSCRNVAIRENHFAVDLIVNNDKCEGVVVFNVETKEFIRLQSEIVMLAAGGAGQVYKRTTNPAVATGDGFAMAYRAGAEMTDMEFVQFHPTTLYGKSKETFLITEAIRGFGAELKSKSGKAFMEGRHPLKSLAPRDIVSRAIVNEMSESGDDCVYLDLTSVNQKELAKQFPNIYKRCADEGIDLSKDMLPVVPAAHYICGGIKTDVKARTSVINLYACGECAGAGVHGANRLASNSLLEGLVFAEQAANEAKIKLHQTKNPVFPNNNNMPSQLIGDEINSEIWNLKKKLQDIMWRYCGIIREKSELVNCLKELNTIKDYTLAIIKSKGFSVNAMELVNMADCSIMICGSALYREESRGCHYRTDYPAKNEMPVHSVISNLTVF